MSYLESCEANQPTTFRWYSAGAAIEAPQWSAPEGSQSTTAGTDAFIISECLGGKFVSASPWISSTGTLVLATDFAGAASRKSTPYLSRAYSMPIPKTGNKSVRRDGTESGLHIQ